LHAKGIIHTKIRPCNILIDELSNGVKILKLADFGNSFYEKYEKTIENYCFR